MPAKKQKIVFEHVGGCGFRKPYKVKKLVNRVEPEVGTSLTKEEVDGYIKGLFNANLEVEIV